MTEFELEVIRHLEGIRNGLLVLNSFLGLIVGMLIAKLWSGRQT